MSLVLLRRFPNRVEADLARLKLADEGIETFLHDAGLNSMFGGGELFAVRLMVPAPFEEQANAILDEISG